MAKQALSTKDLQAGFGVGHMTIYNWRQGTATKDPLPCEVDPSGRVTFPVASTKAWAKKHSLEFNVPTEKAAESKPGPKAKVVKPAAKKAKAEAAAVIENVKHKTSKRADKVSDVMVAASKKRAAGNAEATAQ